MTTFRSSNMIFPSENIYKYIKDIDINLRPGSVAVLFMCRT